MPSIRFEARDGIEIGGSGISATLRDYGRFGLFLLHGGVAAGEAMLLVGRLPLKCIL